VSDKQIKFYMNNPCVIIRDINEEFCEIQLNTHFAANIEAENYCTPSECRSPMSSGEAAQEEYDQAEAILEDIQNEEHSIICMIEKRLLHDKPVEMLLIKSLQVKIKDLEYEFNKTKSLHEEWRRSSKHHESKVKELSFKISGLNLTIENLNIEKEIATKGISKLSEMHKKTLVDIGKYSSGAKQITIAQYNHLVERNDILLALEHGGVDNWDNYGDSLERSGLIDE